MSWTIPSGPDWECASVEMEQAYISFPRNHKSAMRLKQWFNKPAYIADGFWAAGTAKMQCCGSRVCVQGMGRETSDARLMGLLAVKRQRLSRSLFKRSPGHLNRSPG